MTRHATSNSLPFFRNSKLFIYFTIWIFLSSCVAKFPVSTIYANDDQSNSLIQWPEIVDESDTQLVKIRPMENIDEMLLFELEVTNKGAEPIPITPQDWKLAYFSSMAQSNSTLPDSISRPLNGAQVNQGYQKVAKEIKAAKDGTTVLVVLGVIMIVALIVIIASESNNNSGNGVANDHYGSYAGLDVGLNLSFALFNQSYAPPNTEHWREKDKIAYYRQRGQELEKVDNGPHTIPPGETYFYGLFFPRKKAARHLTLDGVVGNEYYEWNFQHDGLNLPKAEL